MKERNTLYINPVTRMSQKYGVYIGVYKLLHAFGYDVAVEFGGRVNTAVVYTTYKDTVDSIVERTDSAIRKTLAENGYYGT